MVDATVKLVALSNLIAAVERNHGRSLEGILWRAEVAIDIALGDLLIATWAHHMDDAGPVADCEVCAALLAAKEAL